MKTSKEKTEKAIFYLEYKGKLSDIIDYLIVNPKIVRVRMQKMLKGVINVD